MRVVSEHGFTREVDVDEDDSYLAGKQACEAILLAEGLIIYSDVFGEYMTPEEEARWLNEAADQAEHERQERFYV